MIDLNGRFVQNSLFFLVSCPSGFYRIPSSMQAREMDKKKEGKPGDARVVLRRSIRDNG